MTTIQWLGFAIICVTGLWGLFSKNQDTEKLAFAIVLMFIGVGMLITWPKL